MEESSIYPGYFHIPGFSRYVISREGRIFNTITKREISCRHNNSGYVIFAGMWNDHGVRRQLSRARALCMTFKPTEMANFLQVDHVDAIHDHDTLDNLEWVTPKENCQRAAKKGLYRGAHAVKVRVYKTKEEMIFPSMAEAGRAFGLSKDAIQYRLEMNDDRVYPEGNQYQFVDKFTNWAEVEDAESEIEQFGTCKRVLVRDLKDGSIHEFEKVGDAAKAVGFSFPFMSDYLHKGKQDVIPGFFIAKFKSDKTPWREISDPIAEYIHNNPECAVVMVHTESKRKFIYLSQVSCAKGQNLRVNTLNFRLKHGVPGRTYPDGFQYRYFSDKEDGSTTSELSRRMMSMASSEMPFTRCFQIG